ncbi:MAG: hypothetical protein JRD93_05695 [Deltaproteobacteria bacterium]|nr:hypothetical protein [Deltaproteobacteria bacterium]MBW2661473.1 hypothetical protein [Deltaproteobacteria bacterium]
MSRFMRFTMTGALVLLFLSSVAKAGTNKSITELFFEANQACKNEQFQEAADKYLVLIENGIENGHIYYNLGNAYFRLGALGKAILSYERARLWLPRDSDLAFNLSYAKDQTQDALTDSQNFSINDVLGLDGVNLYETFFAFAILNVLFFGILCIRLFKKAEWTYYLFIFLAILITISASVFALKWHGVISDDRSVVLAEEVNVLAGPDPEDTVLFKIHEGSVVHYERSEGDWVLLRLSKDKRGWVKSSQMERIIKKKILFN